jgi:hypothetical protein
MLFILGKTAPTSARKTFPAAGADTDADRHPRAAFLPRVVPASDHGVVQHREIARLVSMRRTTFQCSSNSSLYPLRFRRSNIFQYMDRSRVASATPGASMSIRENACSTPPRILAAGRCVSRQKGRKNAAGFRNLP